MLVKGSLQVYVSELAHNDGLPEQRAVGQSVIAGSAWGLVLQLVRVDILQASDVVDLSELLGLLIQGG